MDGELSGPALHRVCSLLEGPGHVGIAHARCSGNQPGDEVRPRLPFRSGCTYPTVHPAVQDGGRVLGVLERTDGDELRQGSFDVEATRLRVSKGGEKRPECLASAQLLELSGIESRALQESSPALLLGGAGQGLVLGGQDGEVFCLALCSPRVSWAERSEPCLASTRGEHVSRALW